MIKYIKRYYINILLFCLRKTNIDYIGMIQRRDHYIYCDYHGRIWKIQPTYDLNIPFRISLIDQP